MQRLLVLVLSLIAILGLLSACAPVTAPGGTGIANPASENCVAQGGTLEIRQGDGGEVGYCVFADGSECEEWALMRGECQPGAQANMPNPASVNCVAQGGTLEIRQGDGGEVGYCVFADGSECEEWALMRGECAPDQQANMPNPASVNCVAQGGTLEIRQGEGGEVGYCVFADGSECEEWALMRGECAPGQQANMPNPASVNCVAQGGTLEIRQGDGGEVGYCVFADGSECEEWALMRGECQPGEAPGNFTDPFAYCAVVGTIDAPDSRYIGEQPPVAVLQDLRQAFDAPADTPDDFYKAGTFWRCADGQVKACFVGANIPCDAKADLSETPNEGTVTFCKENPNAEVVPAAATGRATVFAWSCADGAAVKGEQVLQPDAQGFIAEYWYDIVAESANP